MGERVKKDPVFCISVVVPKYFFCSMLYRISCCSTRVCLNSSIDLPLQWFIHIYYCIWSIFYDLNFSLRFFSSLLYRAFPLINCIFTIGCWEKFRIQNEPRRVRFSGRFALESLSKLYISFNYTPSYNRKAFAHKSSLHKHIWMWTSDRGSTISRGGSNRAG